VTYDQEEDGQRSSDVIISYPNQLVLLEAKWPNLRMDATMIPGSILILICGIIAYSSHMPQEFGLLTLAFLLGLASFTAFGLFLGAVLPSTRAAQGLGLILFFVMMILGGADPPPEVLTGAMDIVGQVTPLRHFIIIMQDPYLGFGWNQNASLIVAGITVVATALAARFFHWE
jgi:ABC-2 type transport system permease protein